MEDYCNLLSVLSGISLGTQNDESLWKLNKDRKFSVKSFYNFLTSREAGENAKVS